MAKKASESTTNQKQEQQDDLLKGQRPKTAYCRSRKVVVFADKSLGQAQQQFAKDLDPNEIMRKYAVTGTFPQPDTEPLYGDFTQIGNFQEAWNKVCAAQTAFHGLEANIRNRFNNDPAQLIGFLENPANREEAKKLGLLKPDTTEVSVSNNRSSEKPADPASAGVGQSK